MLKSHFTFVYNVAKRYIDILYPIGFYLLYQIICVTLKENSKEVELQI